MVNLADKATNTPILLDFIYFSVKPFQKKFNFYLSLYLEEGLSAAQIADQIGCSKSTVLARLWKHGIRNFRTHQTHPKNYRQPQPPYGYAVREGKLVINRRELKVCRLVVNLREREKKTFSEIARELAEKKIKNRRGEISWQHVTVANIFKRWRGKL